jgi:hypothetical protein
MQSIATNHAFVDGNKRTSIILVNLMLDRSGYRLEPADDQEDLNRAIEDFVVECVVEGRAKDHRTRPARLVGRSGTALVTTGRPEPIKRTSKLAAFFAGLTFRIPSFQLSAQGKWSSIGFSLALVVLLAVGSVLALFLAGSLITALGPKTFGADAVAVPFMTLALLLLVWIAKRSFSGWVDQRNLTAAWILSPLFALLSGFLATFILGSVSVLLARKNWDSITSGNEAFTVVAPIGVGALLAVVYMVRRVLSAR